MCLFHFSEVHVCKLQNIKVFVTLQSQGNRFLPRQIFSFTFCPKSIVSNVLNYKNKKDENFREEMISTTLNTYLHQNTNNPALSQSVVCYRSPRASVTSHQTTAHFKFLLTRTTDAGGWGRLLNARITALRSSTVQ